NQATFTVTMSGGPLAGGNSASVVLDLDNGTASDNVDYQAGLETAIANAIAALPANANNPTYDAATNTLTFHAGGPASLAFTVTAVNDDALDSGETIIVHLENPTIVEGTASITTPTATSTITDVDAAVTFAVAVNDAGVSISEENAADNQATFTVTMSGGPLAGGNSASVVLDLDNGTASDNVDYQAGLETAIANAIAALPANANNPTYDAATNTLTFHAGGPSSLAFTVTAVNDDAL